MAKIGIAGCGSWGTALATVLQINGHSIDMWDRDADFVSTLAHGRVNKKYLPAARIGEHISFHNNLEETVVGKDAVIVAVPSHGVRAILEIFPELDEKTIVVSVAKGIENDTLLRVSEIIGEHFAQERIAVLAGPSHAEEVCRCIPTVVVSASSAQATAEWVQQAFMSDRFRVYKHHDVIGVEIGGALKNVVAVAAGIIDGVGAGDNTKAALITRALAEITRLGTKLGADPQTFAGLSGMGDLIVTCTSKYSRNRYVGEQIGRGKTLKQVLADMVMVAEGVLTTKSALQLAQKHEVEVPIISEAHRVLFENKDPEKAVHDLMTRAATVENWG